MKLVHSAKWEPQKEKLSRRGLVQKYKNNSRVNAFSVGSPPGFIQIEFEGDLSRIPSLKNSRHPRRGNLDQDVEARLLAMTELVEETVPELLKVSFGETRLHVVLICGKRSRSFDPDNCLTSIKDWLEPKTKQVGRAKHDRGWGIGLSNDDKFITGYAVHSWQVCGGDSERTILLISTWDRVAKSAARFVASHYLNTEAGDVGEMAKV